MSITNRIKQLSEVLLNETLDDVHDKYYSDIDKDTFLKLISLDPTYEKDSDKMGIYGKWILTLYKRSGIKEDDYYKVTEYLDEFDKIKNNLKDKDINRIKSLPDLKDIIGTDVELSDRQKLRQKQKSVRDIKNNLGDEAELLFDGDDWEIWQPLTERASCALGQGTEWCTASTGDRNYFETYNEEGPLFININKSNPEKKYQFHFQSSQFMDIDDREINLFDFLQDNPELKSFYSTYIQDNFDDIYLNSDSQDDVIRLFSLIENPSEEDAKSFVKKLGFGEYSYEDGRIFYTDKLEDTLEAIMDSNSDISASTVAAILLGDSFQYFWDVDYPFNSRDSKLEMDNMPELKTRLDRLGITTTDIEEAFDGSEEALSKLEGAGISEDDLEDIRIAYSGAYSSGAEGEAVEYIEKAISSVFSDFSLREWGGDDKLKLNLGNINNVKDVLGGDNYDSDYYFMTNYVRYYNDDEPISISEPYYGFSDFDKDYFKDRLLEIIP